MLSYDELSSFNSESNLVPKQVIFYETTESEYIAKATSIKKPPKEKLKNLSVDLKAIQFKKTNSSSGYMVFIQNFHFQLLFTKGPNDWHRISNHFVCLLKLDLIGQSMLLKKTLRL